MQCPSARSYAQMASLTFSVIVLPAENISFRGSCLAVNAQIHNWPNWHLNLHLLLELFTLINADAVS